MTGHDGSDGSRARVFNKAVRSGDAWLWYQWWYDDALRYPALLAPSPACGFPGDFRSL